MTAKPKKKAPNQVEIQARADQDIGYVLAAVEHRPHFRHSLVAGNAATPLFTSGEPPTASERADAFKDLVAELGSGDKRSIGDLLASQALTTDALFTRLAQRSLHNLTEYPEAARLYMQLALKAQASSRSTLEALMKLHQPREQIVKHVTVNEGGQAIVAGSVHHHTGGQDAEQVEQPHAQCPALLRQDTEGNGVPIPGHAERAVSDARREVSRCAEGEPQCVEARPTIG